MLLAQIPQTARVNKKELKAPEVAFTGEPQFTPIEKTTVERAANTDKDIFKVGDSYYMCYQGVWFAGKSASGPWEVASSVPQEIYQIPVSSPAHHVTYVTIEDDDANDDWVRVRGSGRLHRDDGRVGLHRVGLGLVLSAVRRVWRFYYCGTSRPTATPPGTTHGPGRTGAAPASMVPTAAPA